MDSAYSRVRLACVIGTTSILLGLFAVPWATNRDRTDSGAHVYLGNGRLVDLRWGLLDNWDAPGLIADLWLIVYASTVVWLAAGLVPALTCWTVFGTRRRGWRVRILVAVFALLLLSLVFYGLFLQPWENANKFFLGHLREAVVYFRPRPYGDVWLETYVSTVVWLTVGLALGMVGWAVLGVRRIGRRLRYGMAIAGLLAGVLSPHLLGPSIALAVLVLISPSWLTLIVAAVVTIQQAYAVGWIYFGTDGAAVLAGPWLVGLGNVPLASAALVAGVLGPDASSGRRLFRYLPRCDCRTS